MKNILLCVTGSIAAYKAAELANRLVKDGFNVDVIMTDSAQEFVAPLTFQSLTKNRVYTSMWDEYEPDRVEHISLAKKSGFVPGGAGHGQYNRKDCRRHCGRYGDNGDHGAGPCACRYLPRDEYEDV